MTELLNYKAALSWSNRGIASKCQACMRLKGESTCLPAAHRLSILSFRAWRKRSLNSARGRPSFVPPALGA